MYSDILSGLASLLALYLASLLASSLAFYLASSLTFYSGGLLSGIYSDIMVYSGMCLGPRVRASVRAQPDLEPAMVFEPVRAQPDLVCGSVPA